MRSIRTALVIDDDFLMGGVVVESLQQKGLHVRHAENPDEAGRMVENGSFDLVFCDVSLVPARKVVPFNETVPVWIVMTSFAKVDRAVEQIKNEHAYDYLIKPFSREQVHLILARVQELTALKAALNVLEEAPPREAPAAAPVADEIRVNYNLEELERQTILQVLNETGGNRNLMADTLGISIRTLRNKLNKYREQDPLQTG